MISGVIEHSGATFKIFTSLNDSDMLYVPMDRRMCFSGAIKPLDSNENLFCHDACLSQVTDRVDQMSSSII